MALHRDEGCDLGHAGDGDPDRVLVQEANTCWPNLCLMTVCVMTWLMVLQAPLSRGSVDI
jgi:hypothetical protein